VTIRKLALVADTHADGRSRFEDYKRIMLWIAADAAARGCDAMAHAGDVFERRSTSEERIAVAEWMTAVTDEMPLAVVAGNHDDPRDIDLLNRLAGGHDIWAASSPATIRLGGFRFCLLPWPRTAHLLASLPPGHAGNGEDDAKTALRAILTGWGGMARDEEPRILLSHAMVRGSRTSTSQPPLVGQELELSLDDLACAEADFVALGHIHLGQEWAIDAGNWRVPVVYPGSPRRCNFGETEDKGYVVATFDGNHCVEWDRIPTPAPPMLHVSGEWKDGELVTDLTAEQLAQIGAGAEVRLRYDVAASEREPARAAAEARAEQLRGAGATVKVEDRLRIETRARAPEVARALSVADKLVAYWDSTNDDCVGRRDPLLAKLHDLEAS